MRFLCFCLVLSLSMNMVLANSGLAEVSWLSGVNDCSSFSIELNSHLSIIGDLEKIGDSEAAELKEILSTACAPRLLKCGFDVCKENQISEKESKKSLENMVADGERLVWLNAALSCQEFRSELKKRYSSIGSFASLPEDKKSELRYVLDVSCGPRFTHCKFKNCATSNNSISGSQSGKDSKLAAEDSTGSQASETSGGNRVHSRAPLALDDTVTVLAREQFNSLREELLTRQRKMIRAAISRERRQGVDWRTMYNPVELSVMKPGESDFTQPKRLNN